MGLRYSQWRDWNDKDRVEWLFQSPGWQIDTLLRDLAEADASRLRGLIDQKWNGLTDDERVDLLIKGEQWMREGVRARVTPEEAARLGELASSRWASMSDEEKIALLTDQVNIGARETVLQQRESDAARRQQLLQAANDRANERMGRHTRRDQARPSEVLAHPEKLTDLTGRDLSALPDLDGDNLDFVWDMVGFREDGREDDLSTVIRHRGETLWTEPATWEGISRFIEVRGLLRNRYGDRMRFLLPTPSSETDLLGDSFTASDTAILVNFPDLVGERLAFIASYESDELGGPHLHIRCGDRLVWRELSNPRQPTLWWLENIEGLLRRRYREQFGSLTRAADADDIVFGGRLPELRGEKLDFEWGFTTTGWEPFRRAVVLHGGTEIWRDPREYVFPGQAQIESLLRGRYGDRIASITDRSDVEDVLRPPPPERAPPERGPVTAYAWSCEVCGAPAGSVSVDDGGGVRREGFGQRRGLENPREWRLTETEADSLRHALSRGDAADAYAIDHELAPWWCPECRRSYCDEHLDVGPRRWWDPDSPIDSTCPQGHPRKLAD